MKYVQWIGIVVVALVLMACQSTEQGAQTTATTGQATSENPMVFQVGANEVTASEFQQYVDDQLGTTIEQMLTQGMSQDEIIEEAKAFDIKQVMLDQMVQEELLLLLAREEGLGVDPEAVEEEMSRQQELEAAMGGGEPDEMTEEESEAERKKIARQLLVMEMIANHTRRDTFHARHILLSITVPMTATEEERETALEELRPEAEEILEELEAGADFAELAEEHSEDPGSASEGGDLGWVPRGVFVPEFEEAAMSAELNEPVLVASQFGYHIIEVLDRKLDEPFEDLEELRSSRNAGQYIDESFIPWYEEQRAQAEEEGILEINEDYDVSEVELPFPEDMEAFATPTPPAMPTMPEEEEATAEPEEEEEATAEPEEEEEATAEPEEEEEATAEPEEEEEETEEE